MVMGYGNLHNLVMELKFMKGHIRMTKRTDMEHTSGRMELSMKVSSKMILNMGRAIWFTKAEKRSNICGRMVR